MTVKERLKIYLKQKKISATGFGKAIGVSSAYVSSMVKSIPPDKLQRITLQFPDLNTEWLLTGEGEMLKPLADAKENAYLKGTNLNDENEEPLKSKDMEKDFLMELLKGSQSQVDQFLSQQEKMLSQQEKMLSSQDKMLSQQDELIAIIKDLTSRENEEADPKKKSALGDQPKEKGELTPPAERK